MVFLHRFCFIFTIRLGTILICFINLIINSILLVFIIIWVRMPAEETTNLIHEYIGHKRVIHGGDVIEAIEENPALYSQLSLAISIAHGLSCVLGIYAAYMCKETLLLPFVILNFSRDVCGIAVHVFGMTLIKENSQDLGLLISATLSGSFLLMFAFYCDACVYSLWQVLRDPVLRELAEETIGILSEGGSQSVLVYRDGGAYNPARQAKLQVDQKPVQPGIRRSPIDAISPMLLDRGANMQFRLPYYASRLRYSNGFPDVARHPPTDRGYAALIAPVY